MLPTQIITNNRRIEHTADKVFCVLTPVEKQAYLNKNALLRERIFALKCGLSVYEIVCPEVGSGEGSAEGSDIIIPEFLIPGRPYPIYVYIYAMVLYSSNQEMGQREAAERTRKRFSLEKFNYTTLGRAMKKLEALINTNEEKPERDDKAKESRQPATGSFPSVKLTGERRNTVLSYLKEASGNDSQLTQEPSHPQPAISFKRPPYTGGFMDACHRIVDNTFKKYRRLLL